MYNNIILKNCNFFIVRRKEKKNKNKKNCITQNNLLIFNSWYIYTFFRLMSIIIIIIFICLFHYLLFMNHQLPCLSSRRMEVFKQTKVTFLSHKLNPIGNGFKKIVSTIHYLDESLRCHVVR